VAKIMLLTTNPQDGLESRWWTHDDERMLRAAALDSHKKHELTDDPGAADAIVFIGSKDRWMSDVRRHPLYRKYRGKCFLADRQDHILPFVPGVYPSIERRYYSRSRTRGGFYPVVFDNDWISNDTPHESNKYLFSFVGAFRNIPLRMTLGRIEHPRCVIRDTTHFFESPEGESVERHTKFRRDYAEILKTSKFVLCPRGSGPSSYRIFEAMKAARVPVVISDQWVPPPGPRWESFAIRIPEADVAQIPTVLERMEPEAERRGMLAREAWEEWFSRESAFHFVSECCLDMLRSRRLPEAIGRLLVLWQLFRPLHFRHTLLGGIRSVFHRHLA